MFSKLTIIASLATLCLSANAQDLNGRVELSVAGSAQSHVWDGETFRVLNVPLRVGYFVHPQFEIEGEGILTGWDEGNYGKTRFGFTFSGLLAFHPPTGGNVRPFVLAGYGFTNSQPLFGSVAFPNDDEVSTLGVINLGAGFKAFFARSAALRIEYRLQQFAGSADYGGYYGEWDIDFTVHSVNVGVSLFI